MSGSWGPPPMMYPPCPPWAGWYGPWSPLPMPFHPGWSEPAEGFGYGGFYVGDGGAPGQENRTVWNAKPDHLVSKGPARAPGCRHEQDTLKGGLSAYQPESSRGRTGPRSESLIDSKANPDTEKILEEVAAEQNRVLEAKAETRTGAGTSSWWPPNRTVQFL
jgi:hypothetical protein